jgi:two-component system response regulator AlgR
MNAPALTVLVVDDEPLARARLLRQLAALPGIAVVGEADNGEAALDACARWQPQVLLMDIRMPGLDGLGVATQLARLPAPPAIIFCTAYDEYALEAFDANAIGYLLKPVNQHKLEQALAKAARLSPAQCRALAEPRGPRTHISAKSRRGVELIPLAEVRYFIADHKYVTVHHCEGELLINDTLKELEDEFGRRLLRVHRNALVVLDHVWGLQRVELGQYRVKLAGLEHGPLVSRRHLPEVKRILENL